MIERTDTHEIPLRTARRPLERRVLLSFAVVVVAFVGTVVAGLRAQRQDARDVGALSHGYLPLEIALAFAESTQWNVAASLDRLRDDPRADPRAATLPNEGRQATATADWLQTVGRGRPAKLAEARSALKEIGQSNDLESRIFVAAIGREVDAIDADLAEGYIALDDLSSAIKGGDWARAKGLLPTCFRREIGFANRIKQLEERVRDRRDALVINSASRDRRAMAISIGLALLSLVVAAVATRELSIRLAPLGRLTARAKAIAAGDRSPLESDLLGKKAGRSDEISELASAFAAMVDGVATRDADLLRLRRRQEDIVNHLRAAVIAMSVDGSIEAANPIARGLFNVRVGDSLSVAAPMLWAMVQTDVAYAIEQAAEPAPRMGVKVTPDSEVVIDIRVVPIGVGQDDGSPAHRPHLALLVADDVSEAAIARARALQAERLAAIGKMAAHITHEIRNPLSSMGLNVELLDETLAKEEQRTSQHPSQRPAVAGSLKEARQLLAAIAREVGRLADVSEDYLRVARLPSPHAVSVDLASLVRDVVAFAGPELDRARIRTKVSLPSFAVVVPVDEAQVRQALLNLVRNAREAMEDGGVLTIAVSERDGWVSLDVQDQGPGIEESLRTRIFDPFFTTKSTGTGLGLPLTKQIVEAHGGSIACAPVLPHGTRFTLTFRQRGADASA
ncbi:MAG: hypothetical protein NVSMB1_07860 [Polyangiales bacterium]